MTHFDYKVKEITEAELDKKILELYDNSIFTHGDIVRLKGSDSNPVMTVTEIGHKSQTINYNRYMRIALVATCTMFNKSKQDYSSIQFSVLCLEKVNSEKNK